MNKLKLWQNSKTQTVTKVLSICDKTWIKTNLNLWDEKKIKRGLLKEHFDTLTTNAMFSGQLLQFSWCLVWYHNLKIPFNPISFFFQWVGGIITLFRSKQHLFKWSPPNKFNKLFQNIHNKDKNERYYDSYWKSLTVVSFYITIEKIPHTGDKASLDRCG